MKNITEKYLVYEHVFPNEKKYFGITNKTNPTHRWKKNGRGYTKSHQPVMHNAIQKYGWDNIEHNILFTDLPKSEAIKIEKELISKYKTNCHNGNGGYNMTDGGEGNHGHKVSIEARNKMRNSHLGKKGSKCPNSKIVICDEIEYSSRTIFAETHNLNPVTVSA